MTYKLSGLNQFRINQNKEEDLNTLSTNALIENDIINERMKGLNGPLKERIVADIWKEGYKANKAKTFTEDEVRDAIREARFLKDWWNLEFEHSDDYIIDKLRGPRKLVGVEVELESMDVDETYEKYKYDTTRMFHFHHYDSGYKTIKKEFQHLYMHPKETNGIVEVKRHIYE